MNIQIELTFANILSATTFSGQVQTRVQIQQSNQQLADESLKMWDLFREKTDYLKERIIMKKLDTISKTWKYIEDHRSNYIYLQGQRKKLYYLIDMVYKPMIDPHRTIEKWLEAYTSSYFLQFIQGITLFENEDDHDPGKPAYHRQTSCGPNRANETYNLANINCSQHMNLEDLFRKRRNSWNCYVERRIYDEMYKTILNIYEQNFGHRLQLRHIENNNFQSCFPLLYFNFIQIIVLWNAEFIPIGLQFVYKERDDPNGDFRTVIEKYSKEFNHGTYLSNVSCEKIIELGERVHAKHYTQSVLKQHQNLRWAFYGNALRFEGGGETNDKAKRKSKNNLQAMVKSARNRHVRVKMFA